MHDQEMVHGDLKGVGVPANPSHCHLTHSLYQGQHPGRSKWPRTPSRFRVPHHHLRFHEPHRLKFVRNRWYDTMDESRALLSQTSPVSRALDRRSNQIATHLGWLSTRSSAAKHLSHSFTTVSSCGRLSRVNAHRDQTDRRERSSRTTYGRR
jgi:hypothetical protein